MGFKNLEGLALRISTNIGVKQNGITFRKKSMKTKSYKDLIVWQKSFALVQTIYQLTLSFPKEELYGFSQQIRRASVSIPSNIAEGYGRQHSKEYAQFLSIAYGSLEASLYGETARNTHGLDITLKWRTLYASALSRDGAVAGVAVEDRPAQIEFGLGPCEEVDLLDLRS